MPNLVLGRLLRCATVLLAISLSLLGCTDTPAPRGQVDATPSSPPLSTVTPVPLPQAANTTSPIAPTSSASPAATRSLSNLVLVGPTPLLVTATPDPSIPRSGVIVATGRPIVPQQFPLSPTQPDQLATPSPTPPPTPTPPPVLSPPVPVELRYALLDFFVRQFGGIFYCDPDQYPVPRADEPQKAEFQFALLQQTPDTLNPILTRLGLQGAATLSAADKLRIYREAKTLAAIRVTPEADGYRFFVAYLDPEVSNLNSGLTNGVVTEGKVTLRGEMTILKRQIIWLTCPICLAAGTLIDTPAGPIAVQDIQEGMLVWTLDATGQRLSAPVKRISRFDTLPTHQFVRLHLSDGRSLQASPGHPLADGRRLAEIVVGDAVDGARVTSIEYMAPGPHITYDLLPAGSTGVYWADGIPLASTLNDSPATSGFR